MDERYMKKALILARWAIKKDEVPIGCIIVDNESGKIIAAAHNLRNTKKNTLYHAEIIAIHQASKHIGDWRLDKCTMYITIEPCPMCAGAILQARIPRLVYGAKSPKAGAAGSIINILQNPAFNHQLDIKCGVMEQKCSLIMSNFFKSSRFIKG